MLDKHRAPVAPRTPDFWNRDICCHHTESNALPTELRDPWENPGCAPVFTELFYSWPLANGIANAKIKLSCSVVIKLLDGTRRTRPQMEGVIILYNMNHFQVNNWLSFGTNPLHSANGAENTGSVTPTKGLNTLCVLSAQSRTRSSDIALLRSLKQCSADKEYTYWTTLAQCAKTHSRTKASDIAHFVRIV